MEANEDILEIFFPELISIRKTHFLHRRKDIDAIVLELFKMYKSWNLYELNHQLKNVVERKMLFQSVKRLLKQKKIFKVDDPYMKWTFYHPKGALNEVLYGEEKSYEAVKRAIRILNIKIKNKEEKLKVDDLSND